MQRRHSRWISCLAILSGLFVQAHAQADNAAINEAFANTMMGVSDFNEFEEMDLSALMNVSVTSVAGVERGWFETPAAMYVITNEDVRRSGHRNIAEALRLAPGMHIGRISSSVWSVGTRGMGQRFSGHLLVLIDGRSVYTPLFSGTFWDVQDVMLEDLDRIEVIRGPGATLWGANAVNGVINVTTKSAKDTQGWYFSGGAGTHELGFTEARYGGKIGEDIYYRVYGKYDNKAGLVDGSDDEAFDDWSKAQGGLRFDIDGSDGYTFTVQGDFHYIDNQGVRYGLPIYGPVPATSIHIDDNRVMMGNALFRVNKVIDDNSQWTLQGYYDRSERYVIDYHQIRRDTFDLDFRHNFQLNENHEIIWGTGIRYMKERIQRGTIQNYHPLNRDMRTISGFIQDTITLVDGKLFAMVGTKLEDNTFTGFEIQPNARLWWTPNRNHTLWGAVSRPLRIPSRNDREKEFTVGFIDTGIAAGGAPSGVIIPLQLLGTKDVKSEEMLGFEAGHRMRVTDDITVDTTLYFNKYRNLVFQPTNSLVYDNIADGESYGGEVAVQWRVADNWRLQGSYSFNRVQLHGDTAPTLLEATTPKHQFQIRSYLDITPNLEFNSALYFVDETDGNDVPQYVRLDLGMTWRPTEKIEVAVWGQNLVEQSHLEYFDSVQGVALEVPRGVYGQVKFRF